MTLVLIIMGLITLTCIWGLRTDRLFTAVGISAILVGIMTLIVMSYK